MIIDPKKLPDLSFNPKKYDKHVVFLQTQLDLLGFEVNDKDGYFGKNTLKAVNDFQLFYSLPKSNTVDKDFWSKLLYAASLLTEASEEDIPAPRPAWIEEDYSAIEIPKFAVADIEEETMLASENNVKKVIGGVLIIALLLAICLPKK
ncbi:MAG: peptidoglycan-binding domain-containing protein [Nitrospirota bacterium]